MNIAPQDQADLLRDFADEALASLRSLPPQLETYRHAPAQEPINAVFRGIHSLKGNAGFFGLTAIKSFAHSVENTLDEIRGKQAPISVELERSLIAAFDLLEEMVSDAIAGDLSDELSPHALKLLEAIVRQAAPSVTIPDGRGELRRTLLLLTSFSVPGLATPTEWLETVADALLDDLYAKLVGGNDLASNVKAASAVTNGKPTPSQFVEANWNCPALDLAESIQNILQLFLSFEEGTYCDAVGKAFIATSEELATKAREANRENLAAALESAARTFTLVSASPVPLDDMLLSVVWDDLWPELTKLVAVQTSSNTIPPSLPIAPVNDMPPATASVVVKQSKEAVGRLLRVKEERLDEFLNLVARLFITGEMFKDLQSRMAETQQIKPMVEELREIIRSFAEQAHVLQKGLFSLRRVPVANLFAKFPGMARNLARQLDKEVDVRLIGEDVEIDKVLIEDLDAPLTHIIRNAIDHGVDSPAARLSRGVPGCGQLTMKAELTRTHVRILISDDGRGIDAKKLRAKALEKRLYTSDELDAMSDEEAVQLIFHPGFSTAEKLSDVSGRGVGLDVVRNSVRKHRGEVYVTSQVNVGTTFRLEVPLREAVLVIDGLMIRNGGDEFVIPFEFIREITQLDPKQLSPLHGAQVATIRDTVYDARRLSALLDGAFECESMAKPLSAVVVGTQYGQLCLLVDQVVGTRKVVVNGLKDIVSGSSAIAGVAQLGGRRLALVLSVPEIMNTLIVGVAQDRSASVLSCPK